MVLIRSCTCTYLDNGGVSGIDKKLHVGGHTVRFRGDL